MGFFDTVSNIFTPLTGAINNITKLIPDVNAKSELQQKLLEAQMAAASQVMDYEKALLDGQAAIVKAEAQGASWIQRNWRPITMLTFLVLVVCDSFGLLPWRLAPEAWQLLQIGLGGYVVGRSVEKIAPAMADAIKGPPKG
jgi:hypothetical protein